MCVRDEKIVEYLKLRVASSAEKRFLCVAFFFGDERERKQMNHVAPKTVESFVLGTVSRYLRLHPYYPMHATALNKMT